ncbi:MAG: dihydropteroate synthase [Bacteroidales bacterium]|nr:dihydropteroate synthase [Bacteroidales bacterium]
MAIQTGDKTIRVIGIVNITDDSFFSPSRMMDRYGYVDIGGVLEIIGQMQDDGADLIDIGACSSRPGSKGIGPEREWERLGKALPHIRLEFPDIPLSIDTYHSSVIEKACDVAGPVMVNDITSGAGDPKMLETVGRLGLSYVAMHMRGMPEEMQNLTDYENGDVMAAIKKHFEEFALKAEEAGIKDWILDPGFGFAKTTDQNYTILERLGEFEKFGRPIMAGLSRKSMIYKLLEITPEESLPSVQALNMVALERGATLLRVHDVADAMRTVRLFKALNEAKN